MHSSFFLLQLHFTLFVPNYIHIMQILYLVNAFLSKGIIFCFILKNPHLWFVST